MPGCPPAAPSTAISSPFCTRQASLPQGPQRHESARLRDRLGARPSITSGIRACLATTARRFAPQPNRSDWRHADSSRCARLHDHGSAAGPPEHVRSRPGSCRTCRGSVRCARPRPCPGRLIAAISSSVRSKSNTAKFSSHPRLVTDLGNTIVSRWICQRRTTCAGLRSTRRAISVIVSSSSTPPWAIGDHASVAIPWPWP